MLQGPLAQAAFYKPLLNTLVVTAGTLAVILSVSSILAYLVVRTDLAVEKVDRQLGHRPVHLPSWVLALAWLQVFQHSGVGMSAGLLEYYLGVQVPDVARVRPRSHRHHDGPALLSLRLSPHGRAL